MSNSKVSTSQSKFLNSAIIVGSKRGLSMNCPNILSHLQLHLHRHLSDVTHFVPYLTRIFGYFPPLVGPINFKGNNEAFFIYFFAKMTKDIMNEATRGRNLRRRSCSEKANPASLLPASICICICLQVQC